METELISLLKAPAISFFFLLLVFVPMEKVFPAKAKQKFLRPHWILDFCFFLGQYVLWSALVFGLLSHFAEFLTSWVPSSFQASIKNQPFLLQAFEVLILSDFLIYWGHRLQHKVDFLWRFHKVHHSAKHLDWLAAHREHPLDSLYTIGLLTSLPSFSVFLWNL